MKHTSRLTALSAAILVGAVGAMGAPGDADAHHSFAMYDRTKTEVLTGKLTRFIPGANHAQLIFELVDEKGQPVVDEAGKAVVWGIETGPAAAIAKQGITVESFPIGTIMRVKLNPLRNGKTFGVVAGEIVKCGAEMPAGGCNEKTGEVFTDPRNN